jgi:DUF917 family protein
MTGEQARRATIRGSVSRALRLGQALEDESDFARLNALRNVLDGLVLLEGRIHDVQRRADAGLVQGSAAVVGTGSDAGRRLRLEFQSEFLLALEDGATSAAVPELISVLLSSTGEPVATERLREGQRVSVFASPAAEAWRSPEGMSLVGPSAFGYDVRRTPISGEIGDG